MSKFDVVDGAIVNLKDINMPFLNVVDERDDLVAAQCSIALNNAVGNVDKSAIEFQSGRYSDNRTASS